MKKYRVWDEIDKSWIPLEYLMMNPEGKIFTSLREEDDIYLEETIPFKICYFTGLPDKNGKEICEGDIVKCKYGWCGFIVFREGGYWCEEIVTKKINSHAPIFDKWEELEIIGNIYENKDLLDG